MAIAASGAISLSDFRAEYVGGSSAISLGDLYRGGSHIRTKAGNNTATNLAASVPTSGTINFADFHGTAKAFRKTYSSGATNQNASTIFGSDFGVDYPKEIVINSGVELGATTTSEEALQINSAGAGLITITNNGTLSGAGGSAGGGAGGDAFEATTACILINNGTIRSGGGGGGAGGTGGGGQYTTSSTTSMAVSLGAPTGDGRHSITTSQTGNPNFRVSYSYVLSINTHLSTRPSGLNYSVQLVSPAGNNAGSGTFSGYGYTWERATRRYTGSGGRVRYTITGTNIGPFNIAVFASDADPGFSFSMDYNNSTRTVTSTTNTNGGGGGAGGRGQGYNHGSQNGSGGSGGGTNAGTGGTGGNGGGYGAAGATGNTGANGNRTNGSGGSGGGAAGKYIRGISNVTFTNNGTVQGGTA